jgi:hypothetical protein
MPVNTGFEHHGRLSRRDGRPANPGHYELRFALHGDPDGKRACWTEDHLHVTVSPGGFYSVLLGAQTPIKASYFDRGIRHLSVRILRKGEVESETGQRIPFTGRLHQLSVLGDKLDVRIEKLERAETTRGAQPSPEELAQTIEGLEHRVRLLESTRIGSLEQAIKLICQRLDLIDGEGKRLDLLEDRIEDIDGTDGDIVDLIERMHAVETVAPQLFDYLADENPAMELEALEARVLNLERDNLLQPSRTQPVQELSEA